MMNSPRRIALTAALATLIGPLPATAGDILPGEFSATAGFTSDYVFRGQSQTDENPAVQGSLDWAHDSGVYLGVWGSNVDFDDGDQAQVEVDFYGGYSNTVYDALTYDVFAVYFAYPGADDSLNYDYWEIGMGLGYDFGFASVGGSFAWAPDDYFGGSGTGVNGVGTVSVPLPVGDGPIALSIDGEVGRQFIEDNATFGTPDYTWWSIGLSASVEGFDISAYWVDTSLDQAECFGGSDLCEGRAVIAIGRTF